MLRTRKNRRYNEEANDEEEEGGRKFDIQEQIRSERFEQIKDKHLQELPGEAITLKFIQKNGFEKPILVRESHGLNLQVPPKSFLVRDVRNCVGHQRIIDVMDVKTQKNIEMSMKDWCKYYESKNRDRLLNVISLEFSHTKLDDLVDSPLIVKLLDWVDLVWPKFLKESQTESTNTIDKMKYPKVQKYCLMSVKGSYTDFHIDFGGTSVWYHILRGKKIFWMVPPTELNLQTFEEWTLSGMQQDVFFGDTVEECFRVELTAGNTFFIPSGWIHAVYTLEDSLVFGGNFLHSFGIENQLKVSKIEDSTKVPIKFRYPFYTEILWYVVQHYVHCLTGKDHLHKVDSAKSTPEKSTGGKRNESAVEKNDESTESEPEESDTKKRRAPVKRGRGATQLKGSASKRSKKPLTDDESTEIDSANEEYDSKPAEKKSANTCRMTKNSLLRLQYEIDEQTTTKSTNSKQSTKSEIDNTSGKKSSAKKSSNTKELTVKTEQSSPTAKTSVSTNEEAMNLTEMMLSHDSNNLNGWSAQGVSSSGQTIWSNRDSEPTTPPKIHITKIELNGLKVLIKHLSKLSGAKKNMPALIRNSRALLDDCRKLIVGHENDDPELAITGRPITLELLNMRKSNINELIEQFFKPSEPIANDDSTSNHSPRASKSKLDTTFSQQQKSKIKSNTPDCVNSGYNEDKKSVGSSATSDDSTSKASPQKETKCLSPKKLSTSSSPVTASTIPPRPKSPPTRPLSNNQYTSKTKNDNNFLLPGSFADLIAATSTEKDVADLGSSASLFNLMPGSSKATSVKSAPAKEKAQPALKRPIKIQTTQDAQITTTTTTPKSNLTNETGVKSVHPPKPNSPEPPKVSPQKRFINPAFRPPKEKLIFASAPYVSPMSAADHARSGNLYPWQSPAPSNNQTQQHHRSTSNSNTMNGRNQSTSHPVGQSHPSGILNPPFTHDPGKASSHVQPQETPINKPMLSKQSLQNRVIHSQTIQHDKSKQTDEPSNEMRPTVDEALHQAPERQVVSKPNEAPNESPQQRNSSTVSEDPKLTPLIKDEPQVASIVGSTSTVQSTSEIDQKSKKPTKPRGPPKKSKEARQVIETEQQASTYVSVIQNGSVQQASCTGTNFASVSNLALASTDMQRPLSPKREKVKSAPKRPKKQKDDKLEIPAATPTVIQSQPKPSVIGLVTPPISAGNPAVAAKVGHQQYLISRPLMFNTMPTLSSAQLQQMSRAPTPIFTSPIPTSLTMPNLQQGARIVWATQPRRLPAPAATTTAPNLALATASSNSSEIMAPRLPVLSSAAAPDNAALLSLATTALSTAPISSSPAVNQLANRAPVPRAIMVSTAGNQQALFAAGQPFFNPFVQRLPLTQFAATPVARPGVPRPAGQLVFARLPTQQGQPRYLITQPGFIPQPPRGPTLTPSLLQIAQQHGHPFAAYVPPVTDPARDAIAKAMKAKKVKTS